MGSPLMFEQVKRRGPQEKKLVKTLLVTDYTKKEFLRMRAS